MATRISTWEIIFYSIRNKHPDWSKKIITVCTRYAYKRRYQKRG